MDFKKRLNAVVNKDKKTNPKYLEDIIKSDFYYLISNYFEVDFKDIEVEITTENSKYQLSVNCLGERVKLMHTLP
jgi:septum formation topological specificity factor MinE